MTEVRWTAQAADDLQAIYDFIARDSEQYAQVIVEGILAAIDTLEQFPMLAEWFLKDNATIYANLSNHHTESFIELAKKSISSPFFELLACSVEFRITDRIK